MDVDEEGVRTSAGRARVGSVRRHAHLINGPESSVLKEISRRLALNSRTLAEVPIETSVLVPSDKICQPKVVRNQGGKSVYVRVHAGRDSGNKSTLPYQHDKS